MRVREATAADAASIADMNRLLAEETEDRAPDREVVRRGVERGLARPELCRYFLAVADAGAGEVGDETILGQAMVTWEWSDWRDGVVWWFQSVYVDPTARGRGVFRALYEHVEAAARADADARALRLYVEGDNTRARAVYEALGMRRTGYLVYERDWSDAFG